MSARIDERIGSSGYTPPRRDVDELLAALGGADDDEAKRVERALARIGAAAAAGARARFDESRAPLRARLCAVVGRVARDAEDPELADWLILRLDDEDSKTRRRAASALGKIGGPLVEEALIRALDRAGELPDRRALALALGSVGQERGLARLAALPAGDPELERIVREAKLKVERGLGRREPSGIDATVAPRAPLTVLLHVRAGLEPFLLDELGPRRSGRLSGRGRVAVVLDEPLGALFVARTFLHFGFPLKPVDVEGDDVARAATAAIVSPLAVELFTRFSLGKIRYRLAWASGGRRRALNFRVARAVSEVRPELLNDPVAAPWEVVITERNGKSGGQIFVELWPQGIVDPRFSYRRRVMSASSHPTIAAALARAGGARPDDVVWDPFAGSAMELIERALLGPYARLFGSDLDPTALARARENLDAANVARAELFSGDARSLALPSAPSLVITNPPFGKRVRTDVAITPLLDAMLANGARQLRPGGRVVIVSPEPRATRESAERHGFAVDRHGPVDVGGVQAELLRFVLPEQKRR